MFPIAKHYVDFWFFCREHIYTCPDTSIGIYFMANFINFFTILC